MSYSEVRVIDESGTVWVDEAASTSCVAACEKWWQMASIVAMGSDLVS